MLFLRYKMGSLIAPDSRPKYSRWKYIVITVKVDRSQKDNS